MDSGPGGHRRGPGAPSPPRFFVLFADEDGDDLAAYFARRGLGPRPDDQANVVSFVEPREPAEP